MLQILKNSLLLNCVRSKRCCDNVFCSHIRNDGDDGVCVNSDRDGSLDHRDYCSRHPCADYRLRSDRCSFALNLLLNFLLNDLSQMPGLNRFGFRP